MDNQNDLIQAIFDNIADNDDHDTIVSFYEYIFNNDVDGLLAFYNMHRPVLNIILDDAVLLARVLPA
jgi:hypothetical protein